MRRLAAPYIAGADARRCDARRPPAQRRGQARDRRRARRGDRERGRGARDRRAYHAALDADRERAARREHLREADGPRARARTRTSAGRTSRRSSTTRAARGNFVRIDMEDSTTTDATLRLYRELRAAGHENVGVVLQAHLRRTAADLAGPRQRPALQGHLRRAARARLPGAGRDSRQLPRGARRASRAGLLRRDRDPRRAADRARRSAGSGRAASRRDRYEFQMLLGVRAARGDELVRAGHRLRVYVPFGTHWYEYSLRRLQENPKLARLRCAGRHRCGGLQASAGRVASFGDA